MQAVAPSPELPTTTLEMWGGHKLVVTDFFGSATEITDGPQANLNDMYRADPSKEEPDVLVPEHFHHVRQFLVFVDADEPKVRDEERVPRFSFQYTDPSTPYGPMWGDRERMAFYAMRARPDTGGYLLPKHEDKLRSEPRRNILVRMPAAPGVPGAVEPLLEEHPDGLAAYRVVLDADASVEAPAPGGDGQFLVVTGGSLVHDGAELPEESLLWVGPDEEAPTLQAGPAGASVLAVQFPVPDPSVEITEHDVVAEAQG